MKLFASSMMILAARAAGLGVCDMCENWEGVDPLTDNWFQKPYWGAGLENSASTATIVQDPTNSGKGNVLTFTGETHYGDMFSQTNLREVCGSEACVMRIVYKGKDCLLGVSDAHPMQKGDHTHQWYGPMPASEEWTVHEQEFTSPYDPTYLMFEMFGSGPLWVDSIKVFKKSDGDCACPGPTDSSPSADATYSYDSSSDIVFKVSNGRTWKNTGSNRHQFQVATSAEAVGAEPISGPFTTSDGFSVTFPSGAIQLRQSGKFYKLPEDCQCSE